jgi:hypothetical protein
MLYQSRSHYNQSDSRTHREERKRESLILRTKRERVQILTVDSVTAGTETGTLDRASFSYIVVEVLKSTLMIMHARRYAEL